MDEQTEQAGGLPRGGQLWAVISNVSQCGEVLLNTIGTTAKLQSSRHGALHYQHNDGHQLLNATLILRIRKLPRGRELRCPITLELRTPRAPVGSDMPRRQVSKRWRCDLLSGASEPTASSLSGRSRATGLAGSWRSKAGPGVSGPAPCQKGDRSEAETQVCLPRLGHVQRTAGQKAQLGSGPSHPAVPGIVQRALALVTSWVWVQICFQTVWFMTLDRWLHSLNLSYPYLKNGTSPKL